MDGGEFIRMAGKPVFHRLDSARHLLVLLLAVLHDGFEIGGQIFILILILLSSLACFKSRSSSSLA